MTFKISFRLEAFLVVLTTKRLFLVVLVCNVEGRVRAFATNDCMANIAFPLVWLPPLHYDSFSVIPYGRIRKRSVSSRRDRRLSRNLASVLPA